jgi:TonB family protein
MARTTLSLLLLAALSAVPLAPTVAQEPTDAETAAAAPSAAGSFVPPQVILGTQVRPEFPPAAWEARFTGAVLLELTVLEDGAVGDVEVVHCTRPKVGFEDAAIAAVRKWRFEPGVEDGEPVAVKTRIKLNFTRKGVGMGAEPQVSAGSFTVESRMSSSQSVSPSGGGRK